MSKTLCDKRIYHHIFEANCLVSFLWGRAKDSPKIAKFIGKCAENVIA